MKYEKLKTAQGGAQNYVEAHSTSDKMYSNLGLDRCN